MIDSLYLPQINMRSLVDRYDEECPSGIFLAPTWPEPSYQRELLFSTQLFIVIHNIIGREANSPES
jgi:hypothetical protein